MWSYSVDVVLYSLCFALPSESLGSTPAICNDIPLASLGYLTGTYVSSSPGKQCFELRRLKSTTAFPAATMQHCTCQIVVPQMCSFQVSGSLTNSLHVHVCYTWLPLVTKQTIFSLSRSDCFTLHCFSGQFVCFYYFHESIIQLGYNTLFSAAQF